MNILARNKSTLETIFLRWLKEKKAYIPYTMAIPNRNIDFIKQLGHLSTSSWIDSSFTWSKTNEGHEYWNNLHIEWGSFIRDLRTLAKTNTFNEDCLYIMKRHLTLDK